ncbi:DsrE family protein [Aerococcaceae bacterium WGS1372]
MHVVFHINEEERWGMVLSNVNNFLAEEGDTKISIVANGHAVNYYLNDELSDKILNQVDVVACQNSLNNNKINKDQINSLIRVVDSGVVEIAKKQMEGYAYIRP